MAHLRKIGVVITVMVAVALAQPKTASLQFMVVRDGNRKPVRNAEIVLHPVDKRGHQSGDVLELKTHEDGKAAVTGTPYGKLRVKVIAPGLKTYGEDYDINQPKHEITIKMKTPSEPILSL
jgi:hypothetical protein